ncbi:CvpA family protein [Candidatus Poribacteria bacterium]
MSMNVAFIVPVADLVFLGIIAFFAFYGFKRGVLATLYSILRIYFSFIIAVLFYEKLALLLQAMSDMSSAAARIICFTILFVAFLVTMWTTGVFLKKRISKETDSDSGLSRIGGGVLGLLEGVLLISIAIMDINFYTVPDGAKSPLEDAVTYKVIKQVAPGIEYFTISPISRLKDISDGATADDPEPGSP